MKPYVSSSTTARRTFACRIAGHVRSLLLATVALLPLASGGCTVLSNPVNEGIPVRLVPPEFLGPSRDELKTIPPYWLRQAPPTQHLVGAGDTLGIWIEGVLGERGQNPPVAARPSGGDSQSTQPGIGYPIVVADDGTIDIPYIPPLNVDKKTISQVRELIRNTYIEKGILKRGEERILVSLIQPRKYRVQVLREDAATIQFTGSTANSSRRGSGATIELPAYENDVLNALNRTGGLPGLDALNEVVINRTIPGVGTKIIRIPLRMRVGEKLPFAPNDIILENGDIVFIEARDTEVYYCGGLIQSKQIVLPRDYDLRALQAVALANGPIVNGGINNNNLSGNILSEGLGNTSPSQLSIIRRTKHYGLITIKVDMNRAFNDPRENIIIQPGDFLVLQETTGEAFTRYVNNNFRYNFTYQIIRSPFFNAVVTGMGF